MQNIKTVYPGDKKLRDEAMRKAFKAMISSYLKKFYNLFKRKK